MVVVAVEVREVLRTHPLLFLFLDHHIKADATSRMHRLDHELAYRVYILRLQGPKAFIQGLGLRSSSRSRRNSRGGRGGGGRRNLRGGCGQLSRLTDRRAESHSSQCTAAKQSPRHEPGGRKPLHMEMRQCQTPNIS